MTGEQLALTVLVSVVTACAAAAVAHVLQVYRLQKLWKHERTERVAEWARQRLLLRLEPIGSYVDHTVEMFGLVPSESSAWSVDDLAQALKGRQSLRLRAITTGDTALKKAVMEFIGVSAELGKMAGEKTEADDEWYSTEAKLHGSAVDIHRRIEDLLREEYSRAISQL